MTVFFEFLHLKKLAMSIVLLSFSVIWPTASFQQSFCSLSYPTTFKNLKLCIGSIALESRKVIYCPIPMTVLEPVSEKFLNCIFCVGGEKYRQESCFAIFFQFNCQSTCFTLFKILFCVNFSVIKR